MIGRNGDRGRPGHDSYAPSSPPYAEVIAACDSFGTIGLDDLGTAGLMERFDTKVLVPASLAVDLLRQCAREYQVLAVGGIRLSSYSTEYFDTPDYRLYHVHHSGRMPRYKVRERTYVETKERYLEVKLRSGKGQTRKVRVRLDGSAPARLLDLTGDDFLGVHRAVPLEDLGSALHVDYRRLTLVNRDSAERVTIDLGVSFRTTGLATSFPGVAFVEIKQERRERSPALTALRGLGQRAGGGLSKYCLGISALPIPAKKNRFKPMVRLAMRLDGQLPYPTFVGGAGVSSTGSG